MGRIACKKEAIKMPNYDKVIEGLSWMAESYIGLVSDIAKDTLAILETHEPIEPIRKPEIFESLFLCGSCKTKVGFQVRKDDSWRFKYHYCPNCGKAVKWNDD